MYLEMNFHLHLVLLVHLLLPVELLPWLQRGVVVSLFAHMTDFMNGVYCQRRVDAIGNEVLSTYFVYFTCIIIQGPL